MPLQVLEKLYLERWSAWDGVGAIILLPTRELAMQVFDELKKVGKKHSFSAGLLIGGKNVREEASRVHGTPHGRLLHLSTLMVTPCCVCGGALPLTCPPCPQA